MTNFDLTDFFTFSLAYIYADTILKGHFGVVAIQKTLVTKKEELKMGLSTQRQFFLTKK